MSNCIFHPLQYHSQNNQPHKGLTWNLKHNCKVEVFIFFLNMCGSLHALCHFLPPGHLQLHMKCLHDNDSVILAYFHHLFPTVTRWGEHPDK